MNADAAPARRPAAPVNNSRDTSTVEMDVEEDDGVVLPSREDGTGRTNFIYRTLLHKDARVSKLATREDKNHVHKTLGILAVASFLYRYAYVYNTAGNLGFNHGMVDDPVTGAQTYNRKAWAFDWLTMTIHTVLAFSSILFRVPKKRLADKPMVIYEEYRQHAMVFTFRCFLVFASVYGSASGTGHYFGVFAPPIAVTACHLMADRITSIHGTDGNTAVRANSEQGTTLIKTVAKVYSLYQFLAIGSHVLPNPRLADLAYNAVIAIQSSAFMMTLYRKRIIRGTTHMVVYSSCLAVSAFHIVRNLDRVATLLIVMSFLIRINLQRRWSNKYVLWLGFIMAFNARWLGTELAQLPLSNWLSAVQMNHELASVVQGLAVTAAVYMGFGYDHQLRQSQAARKHK